MPSSPLAQTLFLSYRPFATCPLLPFRCPSILPSSWDETWAVVATHCAGGQTLGGFVRTLSRNTRQLERNFKPSPASNYSVVLLAVPLLSLGCARVWTEIVCSVKSLVWLALANHRVYTAGGGADRQKPQLGLAGLFRAIHVLGVLTGTHFQLSGQLPSPYPGSQLRIMIDFARPVSTDGRPVGQITAVPLLRRH